MNQEKISNLIKHLRKKDNLTQAQFANKYNVTFKFELLWKPRYRKYNEGVSIKIFIWVIRTWDQRSGW